MIRSAFAVDPHTAQLRIDSAGLGPDPPHHRRHPAAPARHPHLHRPARVHPQPVQLRGLQLDLDPDRLRRALRRPRRRLDRDRRPATSSCSTASTLGFEPQARRCACAGGTERGAYPALRATFVRPRPRRRQPRSSIAVTLPHPEFLAQDHIRDDLHPGAVRRAAAARRLGLRRAPSPTRRCSTSRCSGPVYLRSSGQPAPRPGRRPPRGRASEIVVDGRIDSIGNGGIRGLFDNLPDEPVTSS